MIVPPSFLPPSSSPSLSLADTGFRAGTGTPSHPTTGRKPDDLQKIHETAQDFEGLFIGQMLQPMFDTLKTDELFGGGIGEENWKSLLVQEYGKQIARNGGIGLTSAVMSAMLASQEATP